MMGSPMVNQGAGPPDGKLAPSGMVAGASRVLSLAMGWLRVARGQRWQLALAVMAVLLASTDAYEQDLQSPSAESWLDSHSVEANLYTRNLPASSVGTADLSHIASTLNLNKVSRSLEVKHDGQGPLSGDSLDLQTFTGLALSTSTSAGSLATTTGLSSKELQHLKTDTLPSSLTLQTVDAEMKQAHTIDAHPMHFQTSPSSVTNSSLHLSKNLTHQTALALNTVPASDQPPSATILTMGKSSPSEHFTGVAQGVPGTQLSSARTVHGIDADQLQVDHNGTVPSTETPGYWNRLKESSPLQSSGSTDSVGVSSADFSPPMRTTAVGTTDERMEDFTSSPAATAYMVSMLKPYDSILSVPPPTQFFDASSESASSQHISGYNGQEFDVTEPATREPLSQSSIWHSSSQFVAPTNAAFVKSSGFTDPRKTEESSTHWLLESLSVESTVDKSSWHTPVPVTESSKVSNASAVNGSHTPAETYTDASLRSVSHYGENLTPGPPSHALSVDTPTSSPDWPAVSESALQDSQWSETSSGLPPRDASLSTMLHSSKASTDPANVGVDQLAVGTTSNVPHSFSAGMPGFGPSPLTIVLDMGFFGTPAKANLFVGDQSSLSTEQTANADLTSLSMLSSYHGLAKDQEDPSATEATPTTFAIESSTPQLKEDSHLVAEEYASPSEASTQVSSDPDGVSFMSMQTSSHPPLSKGEYLHSWAPSAELETSPPEGMAITAHHREWTKTEFHEREEQTLATAKMTLTPFSELPLITSDGTLVTRLFSFASAKPEVQSTHMHDTLQESEATQLPPHDSTHPAVSEQPAELKVSSGAKQSGSSTVHTPTAGSPPLPSYPYMGAAETVTPAEFAPDGTEHAGLVTGSSTELFNTTPSERKIAIATPSHVTTASASVTEAGRSSVAPTQRSVSPDFMSSGSTRASVSKSTTQATEGLMARREWMVPASTMLSSNSNTEVQRPDLKSSMATTTTYKPFLSTEALKAVTSFSAVLDYKAMNAFTDAIGTTVALPVLATAQAVPISTVASSGALSTTSKSRSSTVPAPVTLLQNTSAWLSTLEPFLITTLGSMDTKKNTTAVSSTKVPSSKETKPTVLMSSTKMTEDVHTSEQLVPKFDSQTLIHPTERDYLTLSSPTSRVIVVHTLPLRFRLTGIDYTESLENKSSNSYKKLEKEVRLTLNKMLSSYGNFLHSNILSFLNGSVFVESKAVFQGEGYIPTPSDVIRTIVTEIEKRKMDTFFDWRVDLKSLESNEFSLENLEPEVLTISFTFLRSTATFGGLTDRESLERLRNEVILLLGTQYQVQDFVLDQVGNNQGDLDITGEAYINTSIHVDISWVLEALRGLVNYSVDLSSLSVNGSRLGLQVFPFSFLVTNRKVNKELLDRSSLQHKSLARDLSDVLMHILSSYKNLLQVKIREITGGSLLCHGDVIFQHPAPSSKDVLKTLALAIGPKDYLAASSLQVDRFSFTVAGDGLEPPFTRLGVPGYGVALIVMCALAIIAIPVLNLLPKILGRKDKIIITRTGDLEAGVETFELDNPVFHSTVEARTDTTHAQGGSRLENEDGMS